MLRTRDFKFTDVLTFFEPLFRDKRFRFSAKPNDISSFFRAFRCRFIFTQEWRENGITSPYCPHLFLTSALVWMLLHNKSMLPLMSGYYYIAHKRNNDRLVEYSFHEKNFNLKFAYSKRSAILPFVVAIPDFMEFFFEEEDMQEWRIVKAKHSCRRKDLSQLD